MPERRYSKQFGIEWTPSAQDRQGQSRNKTAAVYAVQGVYLTMLILSRRAGESFLIGDNIRVTVLSARGNQVRIGIDAPKDTAVHREEVYQRMQQGLPPVDNTEEPQGS